MFTEAVCTIMYESYEQNYLNTVRALAQRRVFLTYLDISTLLKVCTMEYG